MAWGQTLISGQEDQGREMVLGQRLRGKTVMVIDDEPSVTRMIYDTLNWHGALIEVANSGSEAYEHLRAQRYDLIICGRLFPGLTGHSLYKLLQSWMPAMNHRFLFISSEVVSVRTWQFFSQAGVQFLRKPFRIQDLLEAVDRLFSRTQPQDS
jgi:DNA-binding response OmpR family regulator